MTIRRLRRERSWILALITLGLAWSTTGAAELEQILDRFDEVQDSILTISAEFTETTTSELLIDPISARGRFFMTKPDSLRWEYSSPEEMRFVISDDQYTGYFPEQQRAERRSIRRWSEQIFRFFGVGQGTPELKKFYDIALDETHDASDGTYLLLLEPKKKRVRKRIPEVRFWLDARTYLPARVEYGSRSGNARVIEFQEIRVNPDLSATLYSVEIPANVKITDGFSGLPDFSVDSAR